MIISASRAQTYAADLQDVERRHQVGVHGVRRLRVGHAVESLEAVTIMIIIISVIHAY